MKEPSECLKKLYALGTIYGLEVNRVMITDDTSETWVVVKGYETSIEFLDKDVIPYLNMTPDYKSIAQVKRHFWKQAEEWFKFMKEEEKDYKEYLRLKEKFDGAGS